MLFAGVAHISFLRAEFRAQVPGWLTSNTSLIDAVVIISGLVEIALGIALIFATGQRAKSGIALAIFFLLIFPGNIHQYINGISAFGLDTDTKRLVRLFFQPLLVIWALWSGGALDSILKTKNDKQ